MPGAAKKASQPAAGAIRGTLPQAQAPQLATLATTAPDGEGWISEVKFDGYRLLVAIDGGTVRLLTRSGLDWTNRMPALAASLAKLGPSSAMLDGELVALQPDGVSSFPMLQGALKAGRDDSLVFYAFDLLHLNGWDLRPCALVERKRILASAVNWTGQACYSDHHQGQVAELHEKAGALGLEGVICKRADRPYRAGRSGDWLKLKCLNREELVVIGYSPPSGSRVGIGGLQLGYYDQEGSLHYAGGVGTGFNEAELQRLRSRLDEMRVETPEALLYAGDPLDRSIVWVRPELIAEVKFTGWAGSGRVRHAVYLGLREEKAAKEVVRDVADPEAPRVTFSKSGRSAGKGWHVAVPPRRNRFELRLETSGHFPFGKFLHHGVVERDVLFRRAGGARLHTNQSGFSRSDL